MAHLSIVNITGFEPQVRSQVPGIAHPVIRWVSVPLWNNLNDCVRLRISFAFFRDVYANNAPGQTMAQFEDLRRRVQAGAGNAVRTATIFLRQGVQPNTYVSVFALVPGTPSPTLEEVIVSLLDPNVNVRAAEFFNVFAAMRNRPVSLNAELNQQLYGRFPAINRHGFNYLTPDQVAQGLRAADVAFMDFGGLARIYCEDSFVPAAQFNPPELLVGFRLPPLQNQQVQAAAGSPAENNHNVIVFNTLQTDELAYYQSIPRHPQQAQAMGMGPNDLANYFVQRPNGLNWHVNNEMYSAEWLHLNAHSMGRWTMDPAGNGVGMEPQSARNLVLGSKAANTWMMILEDFLKYAAMLTVDDLTLPALPNNTHVQRPAFTVSIAIRRACYQGFPSWLPFAIEYEYRIVRNEPNEPVVLWNVTQFNLWNLASPPEALRNQLLGQWTNDLRNLALQQAALPPLLRAAPAAATTKAASAKAAAVSPASGTVVKATPALSFVSELFAALQQDSDAAVQGGWPKLTQVVMAEASSDPAAATRPRDDLIATFTANFGLFRDAATPAIMRKLDLWDVAKDVVADVPSDVNGCYLRDAGELARVVALKMANPVWSSRLRLDPAALRNGWSVSVADVVGFNYILSLPTAATSGKPKGAMTTQATVVLALRAPVSVATITFVCSITAAAADAPQGFTGGFYIAGSAVSSLALRLGRVVSSAAVSSGIAPPSLSVVFDDVAFAAPLDSFGDAFEVTNAQFSGVSYVGTWTAKRGFALRASVLGTTARSDVAASIDGRPPLPIIAVLTPLSALAATLSGFAASDTVANRAVGAGGDIWGLDHRASFADGIASGPSAAVVIVSGIDLNFATATDDAEDGCFVIQVTASVAVDDATRVEAVLACTVSPRPPRGGSPWSFCFDGPPSRPSVASSDGSSLHAIRLVLTLGAPPTLKFFFTAADDDLQQRVQGLPPVSPTSSSRPVTLSDALSTVGSAFRWNGAVFGLMPVQQLLAVAQTVLDRNRWSASSRMERELLIAALAAICTDVDSRCGPSLPPCHDALVLLYACLLPNDDTTGGAAQEGLLGKYQIARFPNRVTSLIARTKLLQSWSAGRSARSQLNNASANGLWTMYLCGHYFVGAVVPGAPDSTARQGSVVLIALGPQVTWDGRAEARTAGCDSFKAIVSASSNGAIDCLVLARPHTDATAIDALIKTHKVTCKTFVFAGNRKEYGAPGRGNILDKLVQVGARAIALPVPSPPPLTVGVLATAKAGPFEVAPGAHVLMRTASVGSSSSIAAETLVVRLTLAPLGIDPSTTRSSSLRAIVWGASAPVVDPALPNTELIADIVIAGVGGGGFRTAHASLCGTPTVIITAASDAPSGGRVPLLGQLLDIPVPHATSPRVDIVTAEISDGSFRPITFVARDERVLLPAPETVDKLRKDIDAITAEQKSRRSIVAAGQDLRATLLSAVKTVAAASARLVLEPAGAVQAPAQTLANAVTALLNVAITALETLVTRATWIRQLQTSFAVWVKHAIRGAILSSVVCSGATSALDRDANLNGQVHDVCVATVAAIRGASASLSAELPVLAALLSSKPLEVAASVRRCSESARRARTAVDDLIAAWPQPPVLDAFGLQPYADSAQRLHDAFVQRMKASTTSSNAQVPPRDVRPLVVVQQHAAAANEPRAAAVFGSYATPDSAPSTLSLQGTTGGGLQVVADSGLKGNQLLLSAALDSCTLGDVLGIPAPITFT